MTSHHERSLHGAAHLSKLTAVLSSDKVVTPATNAQVELAINLVPVLHRAEELLARGTDEPLPGQTRAETEALAQVAMWARDFLTNPHPALGRPGHVCPYMAACWREQKFLLGVLRGAANNPSQADATLLLLGQYFLQLAPTESRLAQRKAIVALFPDLNEPDASAFIDDMHARLKPYFLRNGMMLGEFHRNSTKPGLHNPDFRPLRSDIPLLVIRAMVLTDIAFLSDEESFVRAFLENFPGRGAVELLKFVDSHRDRLPAEQRSMLLDEALASGALRPPAHTT